TAKAVGAPSFAAAGKTGTTSHNENTWFLGYTPLRAAAVWVGYPNSFKAVQGVTVKGQYIPYMYGATIAAPTWKRTMESILKKKDNPSFDQAANDEIYGKPIYVPNVVGKTQADAEATLRSAGFKVKVDSTPVASDKPAGTVAEQSPSSSAPKNSYITLKLSDGSKVAPPENDDDNGDNGNQGNGGGRGNGNGNGGGNGGGNGRGNG
ncbi:MAG TPA: PASTA domain-containing protein, partial [Cellulomonas sp.]|nr:PASTA domain-containing protein [Cellulomonas sp.]